MKSICQKRKKQITEKVNYVWNKIKNYNSEKKLDNNAPNLNCEKNDGNIQINDHIENKMIYDGYGIFF